MQTNSRIIVALDMETQQQAEQVVKKLDPALCRLKVGKSLFTTAGPQWVSSIQSLGFEVFLDLKFHDIPFQVGNSCAAAARLGVWMVNVHALGGLTMLQAAREAVDAIADKTGHKPLLIGVTLLTSHGTKELAEIGLKGTIEEHVIRLAAHCHTAGLDGVVCSAFEVPKIKSQFGKDFICVTPGIRLAQQAHDDQTRVLTPQAALNAGSDYLVMGRSIISHPNPNEILQKLNKADFNELV